MGNFLSKAQEKKKNLQFLYRPTIFKLLVLVVIAQKSEAADLGYWWLKSLMGLGGFNVEEQFVHTR